MDKGQIGQLLKRLVAVDGPSGAEERVGALVAELARPFSSEIRTDALGSVIVRVPGTTDSPPGRLMIAAHLDEIGLIVTKVERGFLRAGKVGGVDPRSLLGQEVTVYASGPGAEQYPGGLAGFIGSRPPHVLSEEERKKVVPLDELWIDLGGKPEEGSAPARMVRIGDRVVVRGPYTELAEGRVASKALDNRASIAVMLGTLGYLVQMQHSWDVYAVATVQEETGLRGAVTTAFSVGPDLAFVIDVTHANTPGLDDTETLEMDAGPALGWGPNLHPGVVRLLRETADALEIPYVTEIIPANSGTDAWAIQIVREGIPCGLASIPIRYMHSATEMAALADLDRTARLLAAAIARLDGSFLPGLAEEV